MTKIDVIQVGARWIAKSSYAQKDQVKAAGFRWDPNAKYWYTLDPKIATLLNDEQAVTKLQTLRNEREQQKQEAIASSRAADADISIPYPEGLAYLPYQKAGIAYALKHANVLFGDEMGLGKTIEAIGVINADESLRKILVVCPATPRLNWKRELEKWLVRKLRIEITTGKSLPQSDIVIINYDILQKHLVELRATMWDLIILDECHYLKNPKAQRTCAVVGIEKRGVRTEPELKARRRVALTGTPIPNSPIEGWSVFHYLAPDAFKNFWYYAKDFCGAYNNGYGWDFSGACNLDKLQEKLRSTIMIRRKKSDVLTELPPKRRQLIEFPANGAQSVVDAENRAYESHERSIDEAHAAVELAKASDDEEEYKKAVRALQDCLHVAFTEMARFRHDTAVAALPQNLEHLANCLEDATHKVVVFAHHHDVINAILDYLTTNKIEAVSLTGETPQAKRQANIDRFQNDPTCRVFVGNIQAAGVAITLTAADHVVFFELDWVPGNVTQAEDRCHRIGQRNSVLVQHLVLDGSLGAKMARTLIDKQAVIDAALDIIPAPKEIKEPAEKPATTTIPRKQLEDEAKQLPAAQVEAIHRGLKILASYDWDRARELNGIGFSKIDNLIGHSLAERIFLTPKQAALGARLVNKYRRQLQPDLVALATGKTASS